MKQTNAIRQRLLTGAVFVGIGLTLSTAVAWGCAYWSHLPASNLDDLESVSSETDPNSFYERTLAWRRGRPDHFPESPELITPYLPGKGVRQTEMMAWSGPSPYFDEEISFEEMSPEEYEAIEWPTTYQLRVVASGWPMHSLKACVWDEWGVEGSYVATEFDEITDGIAISGSLDEFHLLPLRPVAWGMLVSAMFWGGLSYLGFRRVMCFCGT